LFVGCSVGGVSIEEVTKPLLIFMAGLIVTLLLVTYVPAITLFVPKLFGAM
jgi:TRAP-type C4-dicarboxylate transport system permease large subunit